MNPGPCAHQHLWDVAGGRPYTFRRSQHEFSQSLLAQAEWSTIIDAHDEYLRAGLTIQSFTGICGFPVIRGRCGYSFGGGVKSEGVHGAQRS